MSLVHIYLHKWRAVPTLTTTIPNLPNMFCFARKIGNSSSPVVPAVLMDYSDPLPEEITVSPPILQFQYLLSARKRGIVPCFTLCHIPDHEPPAVLNGSVVLDDKTLIFQIGAYEKWALEFESFQEQYQRLRVLTEQPGYPSVVPLLSQHSEKPPVKFSRTCIGDFYKGPEFNGKKFAKEWIGGLAILHHLSTELTVNMIKAIPSQKIVEDDLPIFVEDDDKFLIWWAGAKPGSLRRFLRELHSVQKMSLSIQPQFRFHLPHYTGFYRCMLQEKEIYLDDSSDKPYSWEKETVRSRGLFTNATDREGIVMKLPTRLKLNLSEEPIQILSILLEHENVSLFFLPCDIVSVSKKVAVVRSSNTANNTRVWTSFVNDSSKDKNQKFFSWKGLELTALHNLKAIKVVSYQ